MAGREDVAVVCVSAPLPLLPLPLLLPLLNAVSAVIAKLTCGSSARLLLSRIICCSHADMPAAPGAPP